MAINWKYQGKAGHWKGGNVFCGIAQYEIDRNRADAPKKYCLISGGIGFGKRYDFATAMEAKAFAEKLEAEK